MTNKKNDGITASIVSHSHGSMVEELLSDLEHCHEISRVVITHNIPEPPIRIPAALEEKVILITNARPKGFAANHNAAFKYCENLFYAVLNPDIRFKGDPLDKLLSSMQDAGIGLCAPAVVNTKGEMEDNARKFPTPSGIFLKALGLSDGRYHFRLESQDLDVDWVAGMFMLFRSEDYAFVSGFDEDFFLYYEDVDICARLRKARRTVRICPSVVVTHDARRASRKNLRHLRWHLRSMGRYFIKRLLTY